LRHALELKLELFGDAHPSTLVSRNNLANLLGRAGRPEEARAELERGLSEPASGSEWRRRAEAALASLDG
jgi:hypothetical protein